MNRQLITRDGKPEFVVIPIEEWRRIEAALEDRADAAAVRAFLRQPAETFPDQIAAAIVAGAHPLAALRKHRGLTQAELAGEVGTNSVYLSQIERGERRAGRDLMAKLAAVLRVPAELLDAPRLAARRRRLARERKGTGRRSS